MIKSYHPTLRPTNQQNIIKYPPGHIFSIETEDNNEI